MPYAPCPMPHALQVSHFLKTLINKILEDFIPESHIS
jgi:hypothetical protein